MVLAKLKPRSLLFNRHADCTKFTYDNALRMAGIKNANTGGTVLSQYTYTYDAVNRLSTEELGGVTKTFAYDVRSQLTADGTSSYGYDSAGNRNNSSQTITTGNRLDLDTNWDYSYDDEGNLAGKVSVAIPTVTWSYTWDVNNRMVAAVKSAGSSLYSVDYKYDVFGNRIEQIEDADGAGGGSSVTTRFAWEGAGVLQDAWGNRTTPVGTENWNIWADLNGTNGLVIRYVRGDEVDQLFSRVKADGTVAHYLTDRMQSTRQMLDASGTVANTITYDGFGNVLSETDAAFGDRWKWPGREYNVNTGLQYNRARYYSGESGRWVSEDPLGFGAGDYNVLRTALNRIQNYSDPSGLQDQASDKASHKQGGSVPGYDDAVVPPGEYEVIRFMRVSDYGYYWTFGPIQIGADLAWHSFIVVRGRANDGTYVHIEWGKDLGSDHAKDNQFRLGRPTWPTDKAKIIVKEPILIIGGPHSPLVPCHAYSNGLWYALITGRVIPKPSPPYDPGTKTDADYLPKYGPMKSDGPNYPPN